MIKDIACLRMKAQRQSQLEVKQPRVPVPFGGEATNQTDVVSGQIKKVVQLELISRRYLWHI